MSDIFEKLEEEIKQLKSQEESLTRFLKHLDTNENFDTEDKKTVLGKLKQIMLLQQTLQKTLDEKKNIYETQIKQMKAAVDARQKVLENYDHSEQVFQQFPDLLQYFASKQKRLTEVVEEAKTTVLTTLHV